MLALLAIAGERGVTRDTLLSYLWPDVDEERGRRALTQALYALRRDLGSDEAFLGMKDLRLNPDMVTSDVAEFRDSASAGDLDRAAAVWRGAFLEGFHLPGSDTFERWVEDQRAGLKHDYTALLDQLAARARERGDAKTAAGWLHATVATPEATAPTSPAREEAIIHGDTSGWATVAAPGAIIPSARESETGPRWAVRIAGVVVGGIILFAGYRVWQALSGSH